MIGMKSNMNKVSAKLPAGGVAPNVTSNFFSGEDWQLDSPTPVPCEMALAVHVNGQELITILCTPTKLNYLIAGFIYSEGIINDMDEVASIQISEDEAIANVRLKQSELKALPHRTRTPSGVSFGPEVHRIESNLVATPDEILSLMKQLNQQQKMFQQCGGIHCSALCDRQQILVAAEDIGRHNTLDKILGECLLNGRPTRDCILLTTGRISSEMLLKAARMQTPIIVSRGSPTERAVMLGRDLGITVIGYARDRRLSAFSGESRLLGDKKSHSNIQVGGM